MRRCRWIFAWLATSLLALHAQAAQPEESAEIFAGRGSIQVAFAPWDDAEGLLSETVAGARHQILVQAFLLTSRTFAFSLIDAKTRGVDVQVLADARQHAETPGSLLDLLQRHGIPVWLETRYRSAHNKIVVIDADGQARGSGAKPVVISGSYNFTQLHLERAAHECREPDRDPRPLSIGPTLCTELASPSATGNTASIIITRRH